MREIPRLLEQPRRLKLPEGIDFSDECHILMCGNGCALPELFLKSVIEPMFNAGGYARALHTYTDKVTSDDRPGRLEIPAPKAEPTTENLDPKH
jgi:hypothetical protein